MLRQCLESLVALERPRNADISIVVVENDPEIRSRDVAESVASVSGVPIRYVQEPRPGIPFARNTALDACCAEQPDWIALIDDDERARRDWLTKLHTACLDFEADVANGPVVRIYQGQREPHWWVNQVTKDRPTGTPIRSAATNNILMAAKVVCGEGAGLRFDERFTYGAEDIDFFKRVRDTGARLIWVDDAVVEEDIPASRVTPRRLISRVIMAHSSETQLNALRRGTRYVVLRQLPKALRRIVVGAAAAGVGGVVIPFNRIRGEKVAYYGILRIAKGVGVIRGLLGVSHSYYSRIDGS
ncbi:MAG: glycosyltransferase family 2 protein [Rhodospirillaceae bacterium]|nr:glycosyltransferase family 2 protein [Rhodospirillaceae bacterium]